jgi:hypothetical protein
MWQGAQLVHVGPTEMLAYANQSCGWYLAVPHALGLAQLTAWTQASACCGVDSARACCCCNGPKMVCRHGSVVGLVHYAVGALLAGWWLHVHVVVHYMLKALCLRVDEVASLLAASFIHAVMWSAALLCTWLPLERMLSCKEPRRTKPGFRMLELITAKCLRQLKLSFSGPPKHGGRLCVSRRYANGPRPCQPAMLCQWCVLWRLSARCAAWLTMGLLHQIDVPVTLLRRLAPLQHTTHIGSAKQESVTQLLFRAARNAMQCREACICGSCSQ